MTTFLLILSAMLGTLTQANGFTSNITRCIEWMEVLSAFNQSAIDEEFFAWQDAREQERLDQIMDMPSVNQWEGYNKVYAQLQSEDFAWESRNWSKEDLELHEDLGGLAIYKINPTESEEYVKNRFGELGTVEDMRVAMSRYSNSFNSTPIMEQPVELVEGSPEWIDYQVTMWECGNPYSATPEVNQAIMKELGLTDEDVAVNEWEEQAWQNLVDEVIDAILMDDDYQYMKEWNELTKDWTVCAPEAPAPTREEYLEYLGSDYYELANEWHPIYNNMEWMTTSEIVATLSLEQIEEHKEALNSRAACEDYEEWLDYYTQGALVDDSDDEDTYSHAANETVQAGSSSDVNDWADYQLEISNKNWSNMQDFEETQMEHALGEVLVKEKLDLLKFMIEWQQCHLVS